MTKKRSLGLTLLGWFEIVIGIGGGGIAILFWLYSLAFNSAYGGKNSLLFILTFLSPVILPIFVLILGVGILKKNFLAWISNISIIPIISFILIFIYYTIFDQWKNTMFAQMIYKIITIFIIYIILLIFYLTRPKVRAQFFKPKLESQNNHPNQEGSHDRPMD